jgi:hypothetical protein
MQSLKLQFGAKGFEPLHGGTKNRCLTAWRRPNIVSSEILQNSEKPSFSSPSRIANQSKKEHDKDI